MTRVILVFVQKWHVKKKPLPWFEMWEAQTWHTLMTMSKYRGIIAHYLQPEMKLISSLAESIIGSQ